MYTPSLESGNGVYFITTVFSGLRTSTVRRSAENGGVYSVVGNYKSKVEHAPSNCQHPY
jgi:hypothetical protein